MKRNRLWIVPVAVVAIVVAVEGIVRQLPLPLYAHPIDVVLRHNHDKIVNGNNDYDVVIFGDSRSMGLRGDVPGMSIYNFSVPALPTDYYRILLSLYLKNSRKPLTYVMAAHSNLIVGPRARPAQGLPYPAGAGFLEALKETAEARAAAPLFQRRVARARANTVVGELDYHARLMRMLDWSEALKMHEGMDQLREAYEGLPHLYRTYALRTELKAFLGTSWRAPVRLEGACTECEAIYRNACNKDEWPADRAKRVLALAESRGGYSNLDDFTSPQGRIAFRIVRDRQMQWLREILDDPAPAIDTTVLDELARQATHEGIRFVFLRLPIPVSMKGARSLPLYEQAIRETLAKYPDAHYMTVGPQFFDDDLFIDPLHMSCYGARRLNEDFVRVAPSLSGKGTGTR